VSYAVIVIGGGGHAKVVCDALHQMGQNILGYVAPEPNEGMPIAYLGDDHVLTGYPINEVVLANGIGSINAGGRRAILFDRLKAKGFAFITLIHPSAVVAADVRLGEGCQIMAGSVLQPGVKCAENVIINTRAGVDHDCVIGEHTHISVGATLSGSIHIGSRCFIGAGSTLIQGVSIGDDCLIAAGAVVVSNISDSEKVAGVPARKMCI